MNRGITYLLIVLLIQCALVAVVYWPGTPTSNAPMEPMAPFEQDGIDEIFVGDEFDNETVLRRVGERWILPELENLPADTAMVEKLINAITGGDTGWPVASSVAASQRFQVASYHYQRRISMRGDDKLLGSFFLGSSPGFRKVYARNQAQRAIYSILFNSHDAPGNSGAWLDRKLLQIRTPVSIVGDSYSLQRQDGEWLSGIGQKPDERELLALLSALRSLQIDGVANEDAQRDLAEIEADLVLAVGSLAGEVTLELLHQADRYFIRSSEYPLAFTISAHDYDRLTSIDPRLISGEQPAD